MSTSRWAIARSLLALSLGLAVWAGGIGLRAAAISAAPAAPGAGTCNPRLGAWTRVPAPSDSLYLVAVAMVSPHEGWAAGNGGMQPLHWDGVSWSYYPNPPGTHWFGKALSATSPSNVWLVVGGAARWNGSEWTLFHTEWTKSYGNLWGISTLAPDDTWAVGMTYRTDAGRIMHWDGIAWHDVLTSTVASPVMPLMAIDMLSPTDGWAIGNGSYHWDGVTWQRADAPMQDCYYDGLDMVAGNDVWLAGAADGGKTCMAHWDGANWSQWRSDALPGMYAVAMASSTDGWAVGALGVILHWDGATWSPVPSPTTENIHAVSLVPAQPGQLSCEREAWAVGTGGAILHYVPFRQSVFLPFAAR